MSVTKCLRRKKVKKKKAASSYPIGIFLCLEKYDDGCRERVCSRGDTVNALPRSRSNRICHVTRGRRRRKKEKGRSGCAIVSRWKWFANIILKNETEHLTSVGRAQGETYAALCCSVDNLTAWKEQQTAGARWGADQHVISLLCVDFFSIFSLFFVYFFFSFSAGTNPPRKKEINSTRLVGPGMTSCGGRQLFSSFLL